MYFNGDKQLNIIPGKPTELLYILQCPRSNELESVISLITIIFRTEYSDEPTPTLHQNHHYQDQQSLDHCSTYYKSGTPTPIISIAPTITHVPTAEPSKAPAKIA